MGILFYCPDCERPLNVGSQWANQNGMCPNCRNTILVPADSEIVQAEFRTRLNQWSRKKQIPVSGSGSMDVSQSETATGTLSHRKTPDLPSQRNGSPVPAGIAPKPVSGIVSESQKVARGVVGHVSGASVNVAIKPETVWFVRPPTGGQFGPASGTLMKQWVVEGRVTGDSYIWCEGWNDWQMAGKVFSALATQITGETLMAGNSDVVVAARTRTAYLKARRRRTMWAAAALVIGTLIVIGLMIVLVLVVNNPSA